MFHSEGICAHLSWTSNILIFWAWIMPCHYVWLYFFKLFPVLIVCSHMFSQNLHFVCLELDYDPCESIVPHINSHVLNSQAQKLKPVGRWKLQVIFFCQVFLFYVLLLYFKFVLYSYHHKILFLLCALNNLNISLCKK